MQRSRAAQKLLDIPALLGKSRLMPALAEIRPAALKDVPEMAALLNKIIEIGGTTAFEDAVTSDEVAQWYVQSDALFCCHVAVDDAGRIAGFQSLESDADDKEKIGYIATFARQSPHVKGVGTALFQSTTSTARALGVIKMDAKIRADNTPGLAYYSKMGFVDHDVSRAVPLKDGTPMDRIIKLFIL